LKFFAEVKAVLEKGICRLLNEQNRMNFKMTCPSAAVRLGSFC